MFPNMGTEIPWKLTPRSKKRQHTSVKRPRGRPKTKLTEAQRQATIRRGQKAIKEATSSQIVKSITRDCTAASLHLMGFNQSQIAELLNVSVSTVNNRVNSGLNQTGVFDLLSTSVVQLHRSAPKAAQIVDRVLSLDPIADDGKSFRFPVAFTALILQTANSCLRLTIEHQQRRVQAAAGATATVQAAVAASMAVQQATYQQPNTDEELLTYIKRNITTLNHHLERMENAKALPEATYTVIDDDHRGSPTTPSALPADDNSDDPPVPTEPMGDTDPAAAEKGVPK